MSFEDYSFDDDDDEDCSVPPNSGVEVKMVTVLAWTSMRGRPGPLLVPSGFILVTTVNPWLVSFPDIHFVCSGISASLFLISAVLSKSSNRAL